MKENLKMKLNKSNYYSKKANIEYMSYSQFKDFMKCPAYAIAKINGEWRDNDTESLLIGSYVDSWLDGDLDKFKEEHPEIYNSRTGDLKSNFKQAEELCQVISKDKYLYKRLKGKRQKIYTGSIAGVPFKIRIDSLHLNKNNISDCIDDGKVLKDCEDVWIDGEKKPFIYANKYNWQGAIYREIVKQNTQKELPFVLDVVTKEKTPDKRIFEISKQVLDDSLQEVIAYAPRFYSMKKGETKPIKCGCCDYCKSIKNLTENDIEII